MPEMSIETLKPFCALVRAGEGGGRSATSVLAVATRSIVLTLIATLSSVALSLKGSCSGDKVEVTLPEAGIDPTR